VNDPDHGLLAILAGLEGVAQQADAEVMDFSGSVVSYGNAPGYRDVRVTFDLRPIGEALGQTVHAAISIDPEDGENLARFIAQVHRRAWDRSHARRPIDATPDEERPRWIDRD
jgi:hypothetical protein